LLILFLTTTTGCSDATKRKWTYRSPSTNYRNALEAENADVRRDAVARIAESRQMDSEDAFHVLDVVARTDPVTQIRCVAIRAFSRYDDARPVPTVLTVLQAGPESTDSLPNNDTIRWDAATVLVTLLEKGLLTPDQQTTARNLFLAMIDESNVRNLRLVGLEGLGYVQQQEVMRPLIRSLRAEEDFAIADAAETSLIKLTGRTFDYDPDAWEEWLEQTSDPFAHAGEMPDIQRPKGPTWWDRQKRAWRRGLKLGYE
jgi:HEAT repeat protein